MDLLRALPDLPQGCVADLGCGSGAVAAPLRSLFPARQLVGIDASAEMLAKAEGQYDTLVQADITEWAPQETPALIFSNAALQWVPDHVTILPRLVDSLAPGGTLAVQVPHQNNAPSHRMWRVLAEELCGPLPDGLPDVLRPAGYYHLLAPLGALSLWETEYYQILPACDEGNPVRRFTEATYARPILQALTQAEQTRLIDAYEDVIASAYPASEDGSVLFPLRRMFFTVTRQD
ncbi:methyltransferase domain-containing protein [Sagittula sp. M10.9X]|uniref:Methyltransferase domain-containing protein n=2 Tax=Sagittula salina TaxID=2820268 RepID=A0A940MPY2_9RHOB|nr:methyltransferase domain-containing protein [Sagittula salina]